MNTEKEQIITELLLIRCRRGEVTALDELIKLWEGRLFYYIRRLVSDEEDAWDALQETWLALTQGLGKLREPRSLVMWLYKTARHKAMDRLRDRYKNQTVSLECEEVPETEETQITLSFEDAEMVHSALARLPLPQREALTLYFLEDFSIEEISRILSVSPGTVKYRLHYAKKAMRSILEEEGLPK